MTDPFFSGMFDQNTGAAPSELPKSPEAAPSLLFGLTDKRLPDIFGDGYLQSQLTDSKLGAMSNPADSYNPYETDFARFKNDYNYPTLGYLRDSPNNAAYYMTQTSWQGAKKSAKHFANLTWDTFLNNFAQYGRDFDYLTSSKADSLWDQDYNNEIFERSKEYMDKYYIFGPEGNEESLSKWLPFAKGSLQAYGELFSQLGFTGGTLGAAAVENLVIGALTAGMGNFFTAANSAKKVSKAFSTIYDLVKFMRNENTLTNAIKKTGKALMSPAFYGNVAKKGVNMYQLYHAAAGEAAFEAAAGYAEYKEALESEFREKYGYGPDSEQLARIDKEAKEVGTGRFGLNVATLMLSNSMQWGNYLKPFKASKSVTDEVSDSIFLEVGKTAGKSAFKTKFDYKVFSKGWFGNHLSKGAIGLKGAIPEGFEESIQNVIDIGTKEYIKQKYAVDGERASVLDAAAKGFSETFGTKAGWNNFIAGALTGAISGGMRSASEAIADRGKTAKKARETVARLNSFDLSTIMNQDKANLNIQTDAKTALIQAALGNDKYGHINIRNAAFREFVFSGIKSGKLESRISQLEDFKNMDSKEFAEFFNLDINDVRTEGVTNMVNKLVAKARNIENNYNKISKEFKNPYNPNKYSHTDPKYRDTLVSYAAFEEAKTILASSLDKADESLKRAAELLKLDPKDNYELFPGFSRAEVMDYNERSKKIKELKEVLKGAAQRGPSVLSSRPKVTDAVAEAFGFDTRSVDAIALKQRQLKNLQDLQEAADSKNEKAYFDKIKSIIKESLPKGAEGDAINGSVQITRDYLQLNEDEYVSRRVYDYLRNPENFDKLEQDIKAILFTFMDDSAPVEEKAPDVVTTDPNQPAQKTETVQTATPQAAAATTAEQVKPTPVEETEFPVGTRMYTKTGNYYEVTEVEGDIFKLVNSENSKESSRHRSVIKGWLNSGIISLVPETGTVSTAKNAGIKEALSELDSFKGTLDQLDDFGSNLLDKYELDGADLMVFMTALDKKRDEISRVKPEKNTNGKFSFMGFELYPGIPIVVETKDLPSSGKNRIFAGEVASNGVENNTSGEYIKISDSSGTVVDAYTTSKILAVGEAAVNQFMNKYSTQTTTTAQDKESAKENFDLEQDLLKDQDLINALVDEALTNPEKVIQDFLNNNKTC